MNQAKLNPYSAPLESKPTPSSSDFEHKFHVEFQGQLTKRMSVRIHENSNQKLMMILVVGILMIGVLQFSKLALSQYDKELNGISVFLGFLCFNGLVFWLIEYFGLLGSGIWNGQAHLKEPFRGTLSNSLGIHHVENATIYFDPRNSVLAANEHGACFSIKQRETNDFKPAFSVLPRSCFKHADWDQVCGYLIEAKKRKKQEAKSKRERSEFTLPPADADAIQVRGLSKRQLSIADQASTNGSLTLFFCLLTLTLASLGYSLFCYLDFVSHMNQIPNFNGDGRFNFYNSFKERTNWFAVSTIVGGTSSCSCLYIGRLCWFVRSSAPYIQNDVQPEKFRLSAHSLILIGHRSRIEIDWNEPNERQWYRLSPAGIRISSGFNWLVLIPRRAFKDNDEYQRAVEIVGNKLKRKQWWFLGNK